MLKVLIVICTLILISLAQDATKAPESAQSSKSQESWGTKKYLIVIEFEDKFRCLGAMVQATSVVTSNVCFDNFRFSSKISDKPCKVLAGSKKTVGKDFGIWRFCKRAHKALWPDNSPSASRGTNYITFDIPFDNMDIAPVGPPPLSDGGQCSVYGFTSGEGNSPPGEATDKPKSGAIKVAPVEPPPEPDAKSKRQAPEEGGATSKPSGEKKPEVNQNFQVVEAEVLSMKECRTIYRENMDTDLPDNQFCVAEGGIKDQGRLLICDDKVVGVVSDDLAIIKDGKKIVFAYTYARATSLVLNPKVLWTLCAVHLLSKVFPKQFQQK